MTPSRRSTERRATEWLTWELEFIRRLKDNTPMDWVAKKLQRTTPEVIHMAARLTFLSAHH